VISKNMAPNFMTILEAVQLVLQAGALAVLRAVYFLDMGEPANITQLAKGPSQLSGFNPQENI